MSYEVYEAMCKDLGIPCDESDTVQKGQMKLTQALLDRIVALEKRLNELAPKGDVTWPYLT